MYSTLEIRGNVMLKNLVKATFVAQLLLATTTVFANTYNFTQITSNGNVPVASQLLVDVTQSGSNVLFKFTNSSVIASSITDIYFDYGNTNYFASISNNILGSAGESAGVNYTDGATPANLPAGNTIGFTADASGDSAPPVSANGVNAANEFTAFLGTLGLSNSISDVFAALDSNAFRIGLHVQAIGDLGGSESFVNSPEHPNQVPVPGAIWLFGSAMLGFAGFNKRKS